MSTWRPLKAAERGTVPLGHGYPGFCTTTRTRRTHLSPNISRHGINRLARKAGSSARRRCRYRSVRSWCGRSTGLSGSRHFRAAYSDCDHGEMRRIGTWPRGVRAAAVGVVTGAIAAIATVAIGGDWWIVPFMAAVSGGAAYIAFGATEAPH